MKFLTISGSSRPESSNVKLLQSLGEHISQHNFELASIIYNFPIFEAHLDRTPCDQVSMFKKMLEESDAVIICTPEYIHNIPASIKNAFEWITSAGSLVGKPVIAMTYTPAEPRGKKAMQSLLWSLGALDARVITSISIYSNDIDKTGEKIMGGSGIEMIRGAIEMI